MINATQHSNRVQSLGKRTYGVGLAYISGTRKAFQQDLSQTGEVPTRGRGTTIRTFRRVGRTEFKPYKPEPEDLPLILAIRRKMLDRYGNIYGLAKKYGVPWEQMKRMYGITTGKAKKQHNETRRPVVRKRDLTEVKIVNGVKYTIIRKSHLER